MNFARASLSDLAHPSPSPAQFASPARGVLATTPRLSRGLGRLVELASQLADLVAQPRRVLEAQLLGRGEHLLLELDDRRLDLDGLHVRALLAPAAALGGHLGVGHQELR